MDPSPTLERKPGTETEPAAAESSAPKPQADGYTTNGTANRLAQNFHPPEAAPPVQPKLAGPHVIPRLPAPDPRPLLAMFCYEAPDTTVGAHVGKLAGACARRGSNVQLFSRTGFPKQEGVTVHVAGGGGNDVLASVEEYTRRACAAYLQRFPVGSKAVPMLGHEWS